MAKKPELTEDEQSKLKERRTKAIEKRQKQIDAIKDPKEKQVIELYEKGVQNFAIAKEVYSFANTDSVAQVIGIIRKHYADDYNEVETIKSYKGYAGI